MFVPKGTFLRGAFGVYIFLIARHSSNENSSKAVISILPDSHELNLYRIIVNLFLSNTRVTFILLDIIFMEGPLNGHRVIKTVLWIIYIYIFSVTTGG